MLISFQRFRRSFSKRTIPNRGPASTRHLWRGGFTLVELLVVSAIILVMTAFILFQHSKFNSTTLLRSLAYSIALSVRQAQIYGTSVRESSRNGTFVQGYGVYFPLSGSAPDRYYLFADLDADGNYDSSPVSEALPANFTLSKDYRFKSICMVRIGQSTCDATPVTSLTAYFRRPNPDACLASSATLGACAAGVPPVYSRAYLTVGSAVNDDTRSIKISETGQISVCAPNLSPVTAC